MPFRGIQTGDITSWAKSSNRDRDPSIKGEFTFERIDQISSKEACVMKVLPGTPHDPKLIVLPYITPEPKAHDIDRKLAIANKMNELFNFNRFLEPKPLSGTRASPSDFNQPSNASYAARKKKRSVSL